MWSVGLSSSYIAAYRVSHRPTTWRGATYLQQTVYYLTAHIVGVLGEEGPLGELVDAFRDAVLGLQVLGWAGWLAVGARGSRQQRLLRTSVVGGDVEEGPQGVVDDLMLVLGAARGYDVVELCGGSKMGVACMAGSRAGNHAPSQNCCSFSRLYDTSNAMLGS